MKIFITGIAGFLGSHLANRMIELGHDVSGNDNLIGGEKTNLNKKTPPGATLPAITRPGSFMTPFGVPPLTLIYIYICIHYIYIYI